MFTKNVKDWNESTTEIFNTWTKMSSDVWQNWFDLMGNVSKTTTPTGLSKENWDKTNQLFSDNQDLLLRFMNLSAQAWSEIFPKIETGENWQNIVNKYTDQMRRQLDHFREVSLKISDNNVQLWQLYLEEVQNFNQGFLKQWGLNFNNNLAQELPKSTSAFTELNNLYWNLLYEEGFGSLMRSPILGPTREFTAKLVNNFDAWVQLYRASLDYQLVLADVQVESFKTLMKTLAEKAEKGEAVKDWKEFQGIWSGIADDIFAQAFCQENNLKVRGKFLNYLNQYRIEQQKIVEQYFESLNLPTRSEIDELHKTIHELRKEIKNLKSTKVEQKVPESPQSN